jgi:thioredoxin-related protein
MLRKIVLIMLLISSALMAGEIQWAKDFDSGIKQATAEKKPVFFIISKTTCPPCIRLKETTFKDEEVVKELNTNFVAIISYVDKDDFIPRELSVPYTPSLWFLNSDGTPRYEPLVGAVGAKSFLKALDIVKQDFKEKK